MASPLYAHCVVGIKTQVHFLDQPVINLIDRCEKEGYQGNWNELINEIKKMLPVARGRENLLYYQLAKFYFYQGKFELALEIGNQIGKENLTLKFRFLRTHILLALGNEYSSKNAEASLAMIKEASEETQFLEKAAYNYQEYNIGHENFDYEIRLLKVKVLIASHKDKTEIFHNLSQNIQNLPNSQNSQVLYIYNLSKIFLAKLHCSIDGNLHYANDALKGLDIRSFVKIELQYLHLAARYGVNGENQYQSAMRGLNLAQTLGAQGEIEIFERILKQLNLKSVENYGQFSPMF